MEPSGLPSMGSHRVDTSEQLHFQFSLSCIEERNGNPLQCSCLKNNRDRGAWWAAIYGVTQSWTPLKRLSNSSSRHSVQFSSVTQSCPTLCDPMDCSMPGFPVHPHLQELAQTHVHRVDDVIQHLPSIILCRPLLLLP